MCTKICPFVGKNGVVLQILVIQFRLLKNFSHCYFVDEIPSISREIPGRKHEQFHCEIHIYVHN